MYNNGVMEMVNKIPKNAHVIIIKWEFAKKDNNKKKARLMVRGFKQILRT